jgi:CRISPR-associated endoribonuclease Cas2 subtype I-E
MLPRVADSLSFLYLENVRVVQDDTGVCAYVEQPDGGTSRVYLPVAAISCILFGTGTSVTQPAMATCARHNTTVLWTGAGGVRMYSGSLAPNLTTEWLERQVRAWADDSTRLAVAARMYSMRFGAEVPAGTSLNTLRGLEGQSKPESTMAGTGRIEPDAQFVVISTTAVPDYVRGSLSRWLTEPAPGLYVGSISARVRDSLWEQVSAAVGEGAAVCVHPTDNEQRYVIKTAGERRRRVMDFDGLQLIAFRDLNPPGQGNQNEQPPF